MTSTLAALVVAMFASGPTPQDKDLRYPPETPLEEPRKPDNEDEADATVRFWQQGLEGRRYYLRSPRHPLLTNDAVVIDRAKIRYFYPYDDGHTRRRYRVTMWFENVEPAPPERFRIEIEVIETLDDLYEWLATEFSPLPLESEFEWPAAIQRMVRTRFIAEGMDRTMVGLILGGLEYRVEQETLDDGRPREVWSLKDSRRARKAFSTRRSVKRSPVPEAGAQAPGTGGQPPGFYLFDLDGPEDLSIIFIDGQVTPP